MLPTYAARVERSRTGKLPTIPKAQSNLEKTPDALTEIPTQMEDNDKSGTATEGTSTANSNSATGITDRQALLRRIAEARQTVKDEKWENIPLDNAKPVKKFDQFKTLSKEELKSYYSPKPLSLFQSLRFWITLTYNKLKSTAQPPVPNQGGVAIAPPNGTTWSAYNEVLPGVYLGRIPEGDALPADVGMFVSVISAGEFSKVKFPWSRISHAAEREGGAEHVHLAMEDFDSKVSPGALIETLDKMKHFLESNPGKKIYVHCKAGAARSASVVAAYHTYTEKINVNTTVGEVKDMFRESVNTLHEKRDQVDVGDKKAASFVAILESTITLKAQAADAKVAMPPAKDEATQLLEIKSRLRHIYAFKILSDYAIDHPGELRSLNILNFYKALLKSTTLDELKTCLTTKGKYFDAPGTIIFSTKYLFQFVGPKDHRLFNNRVVLANSFIAEANAIINEVTGDNKQLDKFQGKPTLEVITL